MSDSFDPRRRLCPDGSCIGVIGADGRCGECGRTTDGKPRVLEGGASVAGAEDMSNSNSDSADEAADEAEALLAGPGDGAGFDPSRRLCDDGSCVGVVGADGRCGVCGRQVA